MKTGILIGLSIILLCGNAIAGNNYIIDNDTVYINDSKVYLSATPHTLSSSGWVYFNLTSKVYTGNIDACWGFNTSVSKPVNAELYKPHWVNTTTNHEKTFYNPSFVVYTGDILDYGNSYNINYKYTITEPIVNENGTTYITSNAAFDSFDTDETNYTVYWYTRQDNHYLWKDFSSSFNSVIYNYEGFNKWYYIKDIPIISNTEYTVRVWVDVPISTEKQFGKYYFAIKPSGETISQAVNNGHFYNLDPWWNVTWLTRTEIILTGNTSGAQTNYQMLLNVSYESEMQTDFDDLRFCNDTHEIDSWLESKVDSSYALIWVEFPTTPANGINQTYYMYYGKADAASDWDGAATFPVLFDDFEDGDVSDWVTGGSNAFVADGTIKKEGGYSGKSTVAGTQGDETYKTFTATTEAVFEFDIRFNLNTIYYFITLDETVESPQNSVLLRIKNDGSIFYYDGSYHSLGGAGTIVADTFYEFKVVSHSATDTFDIWIDGVSKGAGLGTRGDIDTGIRSIALSGGGIPDGIAYIDNVFQHKYVANPPTYTFSIESYYINNIHYNISNPYNHTIESDGTITANHSITVIDNIGWTVAALTDDCHLVVTKYDLSNIIMSNFTLYTSTLDWLTVPALSSYTNYNLSFSNGTLIEQQITNSAGIAYFITNLTVGSYIIEKGERIHPFSEEAYSFYNEMKSGLTDFRDSMGKYLVWGILFFAVGLAFTIFAKIKQTLVGNK